MDNGPLGVLGAGALFDSHVFKFAGFEDLGTFEALDKFGVLVPSHNSHAGVLARLVHAGSLA
jgi:hypothetical protein